MTTRPTDAEDLVEPQFACPRCGERSMEMLARDMDGETVACQECGKRYAPNAAPDEDELAADRMASDLLDIAADMRERYEAEDRQFTGL